MKRQRVNKIEKSDVTAFDLGPAATYLREAVGSRPGMLVFDPLEPHPLTELDIFKAISENLSSLGDNVYAVQTENIPTCLFILEKDEDVKSRLSSLPESLRHVRIGITWKGVAVPG